MDMVGSEERNQMMTVREGAEVVFASGNGDFGVAEVMIKMGL